MERGREDSSGPAHRSSEGADPEEAPRQAAPLGGSLPFNCTAQIAVAPTSRSWQRAPTGVSVSPARAAAALRILRHRHHGRLGLQPAGREQVHLHPRYARRGFPGSATGPPGAWGQAGRPGTGPGAGNPRGTCRAPALHGRLKSCGRGDDPGAQPLPSQSCGPAQTPKTPDSPLEQSGPPQPGSQWQVSGETQRPCTHSSVHKAAGGQKRGRKNRTSVKTKPSGQGAQSTL